MKIFSKELNSQIVFIILVMHSVLCAQDKNSFFFKDLPSTYLPAYQNVITEVSYTVANHNQIAITLHCDKNPICMYTPLTYEDLSQTYGTKTYYLPCTSCTKDQLRYFSERVGALLDKAGIVFRIEEIKKIRGLHFLSKSCGLRVSFMIKSQSDYDIAKIIDDKNKTISFNIVEKI